MSRDRHVRRAFRALDHLARRIASRLRIQWARLRFPGLTVGRGVTFGRGVQITVLNDARLTIGERTAIEQYCQLRSDGLLQIGPDGFIGQGSVLIASKQLTIGDDALIAAYTTIRDQDHGTGAAPYRAQPINSAPVSIGDNVWLGTGVTVLKGVSIGDNCIVGAGAVVTRSLPAGVTAVGIPAVQKRSANGKVGRPPRTASR